MKKSPVVGGDMMGFRNPKAAWFEQRQGGEIRKRR